MFKIQETYLLIIYSIRTSSTPWIYTDLPVTQGVKDWCFWKHLQLLRIKRSCRLFLHSSGKLRRPQVGLNKLWEVLELGSESITTKYGQVCTKQKVELHSKFYISNTIFFNDSFCLDYLISSGNRNLKL